MISVQPGSHCYDRSSETLWQYDGAAWTEVPPQDWPDGMVGKLTTGPWFIDAETLQLVGPEPGRTYSGEEFAAQEWPPCPVCGTTVMPQPFDVSGLADRLPVYTVGRWACPNECDPPPPGRRP